MNVTQTVYLDLDQVALEAAQKCYAIDMSFNKGIVIARMQLAVLAAIERARMTTDETSAVKKIENACQAASETQRSWKHRCHAILSALDLDFGDPDEEIPELAPIAWRDMKDAPKTGEKILLFVEGEDPEVVVGFWETWISDEPDTDSAGWQYAEKLVSIEVGSIQEQVLAWAPINEPRVDHG